MQTEIIRIINVYFRAKTALKAAEMRFLFSFHVGTILVELLGSLVVLDDTADGDCVTDLQIGTAGESVALDDVVIEAADLDLDGDVAVLLAVGAGDGNDGTGYLNYKN